MTRSSDLFGASITRTYHDYLGPMIFEEYALDLAERLMVPGTESILETACGTGVLTRHLMGRLDGRGSVVATDVNPGMLDAATENLRGTDRIEFRTADATELPFADDSFDAVACQFGVMFYPDKERGYREAARVLRPGGRFVFNVWDSLERNAFCGLVHETVSRLFADDPPNFMELPFGYHDLSEIRDGLHRAGFGEIAFTVLPRESRARSAADVARGFVFGSPLADQLAAAGTERQTFGAVEAAVKERYGSGEVAAPMQSIAVVAVLPER